MSRLVHHSIGTHTNQPLYPSPEADKHTVEIFKELGLEVDEMRILAREGAMD